SVALSLADMLPSVSVANACTALLSVSVMPPSLPVLLQPPPPPPPLVTYSDVNAAVKPHQIILLGEPVRGKETAFTGAPCASVSAADADAVTPTGHNRMIRVAGATSSNAVGGGAGIGGQLSGSSGAGAASAAGGHIDDGDSDNGAGARDLSGIMNGVRISGDGTTWDSEARYGDGGSVGLLQHTASAKDATDNAASMASMPVIFRTCHPAMGGEGDGDGDDSNGSGSGCRDDKTAVYCRTLPVPLPANGLEDSGDARHPPAVQTRSGATRPFRLLAARVMRYVRGSNSCSDSADGAGGILQQLYGSSIGACGDLDARSGGSCRGGTAAFLQAGPTSPPYDLPCVMSPTGAPTMPPAGSVAGLLMPHVRHPAALLVEETRPVFGSQVTGSSRCYSVTGSAWDINTPSFGGFSPYCSSLIQGLPCTATAAAAISPGADASTSTTTIVALSSCAANALHSTPMLFVPPGGVNGSEGSSSRISQWFSRHAVLPGTSAPQIGAIGATVSMAGAAPPPPRSPDLPAEAYGQGFLQLIRAPGDSNGNSNGTCNRNSNNKSNRNRNRNRSGSGGGGNDGSIGETQGPRWSPGSLAAGLSRALRMQRSPPPPRQLQQAAMDASPVVLTAPSVRQQPSEGTNCGATAAATTATTAAA
ncbi:hypothetical protein Vretimale_11006, partial [Volvox reticuliferus]